jgi:hypothetical protein
MLSVDFMGLMLLIDLMIYTLHYVSK